MRNKDLSLLFDSRFYIIIIIIAVESVTWLAVISYLVILFVSFKIHAKKWRAFFLYISVNWIYSD